MNWNTACKPTVKPKKEETTQTEMLNLNISIEERKNFKKTINPLYQ